MIAGRVGRFCGWRAWFTIVALACGAAAASARVPPDWIKAQLAADVAGLAGAHSAVSLLQSGDVRYITEDRVRRIYRGAVRVMHQQGRDAAKCVYIYNPDTEKVVSAQAWIIAPDGRRAEIVATRQFADTPYHIGRYSWLQQRVLWFSAADRIAIGGVLAWEFQIESQSGISDVNWSFDASIPVNHSVLEVTPMPGGKIEWHAASSHMPAPAAGGAPGALRWEMRALAPAVGDPPEGFLPEPLLVSARGVPARGPARLQTWAGFARMTAEVIEPRIVVSPEVKAKAAELVAGRSGRWERIRALTEFVQKDITYLAVSLEKDYLAGYRPHAAGDVLKNRYGDCKDKSALLVALLRATGDNGHVVLVFAGNPKAVRADWPAAAFNHAIVGLPADDAVPATWPVVDAGPLGSLVMFDPTDAHTPLGVLVASDQAGFGLVASAQASHLIALPDAAADANRYRCRIDAAVDAEGTLTAKVEENARGGAGAARHALRERMNQEQFKRAIEARLHETIPLLQELKWSNAWQPADAAWELRLEFKAERYARRTGGTLMLVSPQVLVTTPRLSPWKTDQPGVAWMAAARLEKEVRLALPAEVAIEELPDPVMLEGAGASARVTYDREAGAVIYKFELIRKGGMLGRSEYEELRAFVQKVQEAERRPIVLRRIAGSN